jgi:opacity protein-like surface antigen
VAIIPGSANAGGFDLACESTSTLVKGGVYSPDAEGAPDGIFGGVEHAARIAPTFEMGAALDYFYRRRSSPPHLFEDDGHPYDIPIEGEASEFASSTHLASLGLNGRLLLPLGDRGPSPFVEAGLALQVLHLRARDEGGRSDRIQSDTFGGIGWHVGAGVEQPLGHSVSLLGEAGWSHAEPRKEIEEDGRSVTYTAMASGGYIRAGLRFTH